MGHMNVAHNTTSMTSVGPSVTLVDCDHIVQQKLEIGKWQSIVFSPGYLYAEAVAERSIL